MANFHSINGNEVEAHYAGGDLQDEIDLKAETDGYYTMLTAGAADNLTARGDGVTASYLYRTTGGSASVPDDAEATIRSIKGRTLVWNQLISQPNASDTVLNGAVTRVRKTDDGTLTLNGTAAGTGSRQYVALAAGISIMSGHKYYLAKHNDALIFYINVYGSYNSITNVASIFTAGESRANAEMYMVVPNDGYAFDSFVCVPQLFDLTAMFGAGNEPATVAEFEALYPESYYPYDAGSLLPVNMTGVETTGFNAYNGTTGTAKLLGGYQYQITGTYTSLSFETVGGETEVPALDTDGIFQTSANGTLTVTGGGSDTCVHLVWSGYRNGEYEPHWSEQRVISAIAENFPNGMRSAGSAYDELTEHEAIVRVGAVDLADITWTDSTNYYSTAYVLPNAKTPASGGVVANMSCADYEVTSSNNVSAGVVSNGIGLRPNGTLYVSKGSASPAGMLFYELATPTTTTFPHPINMDYRFADFGTERVMVPTGQMSAPPTMDVVYGLNAPDTLRTLPTEYVSKASDASFTAALGTFLNATITREWNETNQRYDYTITANGE